jgi:hypothetical protein
MPRPLLALAACAALVTAVAGCGGGDGGRDTTSERAPAGAAPVRRGDAAQAAARHTAEYKAAVNGVLTGYLAAERRAFGSLRASEGATFVGALRRLRRSTARAADRLESARPPAAAAAPHRRFVAAFRALERIIQAAIDARNTADFARLRRVGRRLQSGEFSRPIARAAREIDAALGARGG